MELLILVFALMLIPLALEVLAGLARVGGWLMDELITIVELFQR